MQLVPRLTDDPDVLRREAPVSRHLPYSHHVDARTVALTDGRLMQVVRLGGLLFETADNEDLEQRAAVRDAILRNFGSSRYAVTHHVVRRPVSPSLEADFADDFSRGLDERWRARLEGRRLYANDLYLTVIRRPLRGKVGWLDRLKGRAAKASDKAFRAAEIKQLTAAVEAMVSSLSAYAPEVLTVREQGGTMWSEPAAFLAGLLDGRDVPVLLPHGPLADSLATRRISFGHDAVEFAPSGAEPRRFAAVLSIKDYAGQTAAGMFDDLYRLPIEMCVAQSFALVDRSEALSRMNLALRRMKSAEDEAVSLREELYIAKDEVAAGRAAYGEHHATVTVRADSLEELDEAAAEVIALFADLGIVAVREEVGLEPAFWAQCPGNFKYIARRALISTRNFAGFASLHNFASGRANGNHWGEAVTLLETTAAGPYFFNFHKSDLGNFTVIGPSGSGKTVILNFLLAQARRFDPRIVFFDKDRGAEIFIRAVGGNYDRLNPGVASGLNPLAIEDTPANRRFLHEWIALLADGVTVEEEAEIRDAIDANFGQPMEMRRLRILVELFRGGARPMPTDLYARLRPWWGNGKHAWLFDNEEDLTDLAADTVGFDMTSILDRPKLRTPAMAYLFHRVEERLDGKPTIIVVDEGWKALDDEMFVRSLRDWEKTVRKRNAIVGFATQSAEDALDSSISSAIIEQAATQIFTVNPRAKREHYVEGFGLSDYEFRLLKALPEESRCFLVKQGNESAIVRLDLSGDGELLTVLSGRESSVRLLDKIRADVGSAPADWLPALLEGVA